jgi:hypothetical protein
MSDLRYEVVRSASSRPVESYVKAHQQRPGRVTELRAHLQSVK